MHKLERYGVVALVFLLVTIIAVSLWSGGSDGDFWSRFWTGPEQAPVALSDSPARPRSQNPAARSDPAWSPPTLARGTGRTSSAPARRAPGRRPIRESADQAPLQPRTNAANRTGGPRGRQASRTAEAVPTTVAPDTRATRRPSRSTTTPSAASPDSYVVRSGDTLSGIAKKLLGSGNRWREIASLNPGIDPDRIEVGAKLALRAAAPVTTPRTTPREAGRTTDQNRPSASSTPTYVVAAGDTLSAIAQRLLGSASRWGEIVKLNPGLDPDRLHVGKRLTLPAGAVAAPGRAPGRAPTAELTTRLASAAGTTAARPASGSRVR